MEGTLEERFWAKVDKRGPDDCWDWLEEASRDSVKAQTVGQMALGV